jgi:hypothetical protein
LLGDAACLLAAINSAFVGKHGRRFKLACKSREQNEGGRRRFYRNGPADAPHSPSYVFARPGWSIGERFVLKSYADAGEDRRTASERTYPKRRLDPAP